MEIPSPSAGTITALTIKLGDTVNVGDVVGQMTVQGAVAAPCRPPLPWLRRLPLLRLQHL